MGMLGVAGGGVWTWGRAVWVGSGGRVVGCWLLCAMLCWNGVVATPHRWHITGPREVRCSPRDGTVQRIAGRQRQVRDRYPGPGTVGPW